MTDQEILEQAEDHLVQAFQLLSRHTHGDDAQGKLLGEAQAAISAAVRRIRQLG